MTKAPRKPQSTNFKPQRSLRALWGLFFIVFGFSPAWSEQPAKEPKVSATGFIEYWPGTLPVILSAPHGGTVAPKELPDRQFGKVMRDDRTIELTMAKIS